ncbi:MAG: hypothetical protein M1817_005594 [Caeruleum heppii]|nr:MAG: hypothetical protein M1817_005594 [Caeruleum heppii]
MDAKPQRPLRTLRVHPDENAPIELGNKTLHGRYKSTGTLATAAAGGLKAAAKRTAFGDVSNTARTVFPSKDDSLLPAKKANDFPVKTINPSLAKKTAALLRPAQRPLAPTVPRIEDPISNVHNAVIPPPLAVPSPKATQQPVIQKPIAKRTTTVFKDGPANDLRPASVHEASTARSTASVAPIHQDLSRGSVVEQHVAAHSIPTLPQVYHEAVESATLAELKKVSAVPTFSDEVLGLVADRLHPDAVEQHHQEANGLLVSDEVNHRNARPETKLSQQEHNQQVMEQLIEERDRLLEKDAKVTKPQPVAPLPISDVTEPEEYWEEHHDDHYAEDGYTEAQTHRSRGDNTTGGVTTVVLPKVTAKVKKELAAAKDIVESARSQDDIEAEEWDTTMVAEYSDEIFEYMRELEIKMLPNAHYMDNQAEIQWSMRSVLMDWLVQVHHRFNLLPETLFLCANYIDRFLSCKIVSLGKLQLVGATAIFVAAKYEEINCPSVQEIVYMVDGGYTIDEILKAERFMLSMLQFELGWPGPLSFLRRISKADDYDLETRTLAKYFLEISIMDERFVGSPPSFIAAAAHCLSRMMLKKGDWAPGHVYYSGYTYSQLRPLLLLMLECCENPSQHHQAVYDKYSDRRYKRASIFTEGEIRKGFRLPEVPVSAAVVAAEKAFPQYRVGRDVDRKIAVY